MYIYASRTLNMQSMGNQLATYDTYQNCLCDTIWDPVLLPRCQTPPAKNASGRRRV